VDEPKKLELFAGQHLSLPVGRPLGVQAGNKS
jgi:hypothetical protein